MKKIILLLIIMFIIGCGCANKAKVGYKSFSTNVEYKVVYENGLLLMQDDVIKIILKFERKSLARFFLTDTFESIRIYILSNKYSINDGSILLENPKIFFIKNPAFSFSYGYMTGKSITIKKDTGKMILSGSLACSKLIEGDVFLNTFNFSFKNLQLPKASSTSEMLEFVYFKEIIHDNFSEFYNNNRTSH